MKRALWKLYLLGRKNEYKLIGFVWARADQIPQGTITKPHAHMNLCADKVKDTSHEQEWWMKPWPEDLKW